MKEGFFPVDVLETNQKKKKCIHTLKVVHQLCGPALITRQTKQELLVTTHSANKGGREGGGGCTIQGGRDGEEGGSGCTIQGGRDGEERWEGVHSSKFNTIF